jgi:glucosamine--fructose-6-phosphate aminotransferase (isomerizing)
VIDFQKTLMFLEASSAHEAVQCQLRDDMDVMHGIADALRAAPPKMVVTCARGSSDHAASFAKYMFETRLGWVTASAAPSVSSVYQADLALQDSLFLAISQSGASPDLLDATRRAKQKGARTVAMVNVADSPLSQIADWTIPLRAGPEKSVAATKSYIASLSAISTLILAIARRSNCHSSMAELPALLRSAQQMDWSALADGLVSERGMFVLGRGPGFSVAQEAALKFKETCGLHAEAFSAAEVRHGPMALAATGIPMLVFRQNDASAAGVDQLVRDLVDVGAKVFVAGAEIDGAIHLPAQTCDPVLEPILQIQSFYLAAARLSVARGHNPDAPPLLKKVTETV